MEHLCVDSIAAYSRRIMRGFQYYTNIGANCYIAPALRKTPDDTRVEMGEIGSSLNAKSNFRKAT